MGHCSNCGAEFIQETNFCPNCGAARAEAAQAEVFEAAAGATPAVEPAAPAAAANVGQPPIQPQKIENHLIKSIITMICCCPPFGLVGIAYAAQVDAFLKQGNRAAAEEASKKAGLWSSLAIGVGFLAYMSLAIITIVYQMKVLNVFDVP
jgi:hypothetical protein